MRSSPPPGDGNRQSSASPLLEVTPTGKIGPRRTQPRRRDVKGAHGGELNYPTSAASAVRR